MRIAVVGGGPGGLYFAALAQQLDPSHEITVWERNAADDTFGFGVVFSDETLGGIEHADPAIHHAMSQEFARWDDIDIHYRGSVITVGRARLRCDEPPAPARDPATPLRRARGRHSASAAEAPPVDVLADDFDLVVGSDGVNSATRARYAETFRPDLDVRCCKFMWLGTDLVFDAFKFYIVDTPHGVMQIHGYPFDAQGSTFIVEMNDEVWRRAGFDAIASREFQPGESDRRSIDEIRRLFADDPRRPRDPCQQLAMDQLHHGAQRSAGISGNVVLLGDAAHTAHFSIGSGTKLAMEDALALAACTARERDVDGRARARTRASAGRSWCRPSERRAGEPGVVREPRPVRAPGPPAVRLQHPDPKPSRHLREPAAARPGVRRRGRRWFAGTVRRKTRARRRSRPRCSSRSGCASSS